MNKKAKHLLMPVIIPLTFTVIALTPIEILGCRLRGLIAVSIALSGALLAITTVLKGLIDRIKEKPDSGWWLATTLILALPAVYIVLVEI